MVSLRFPNARHEALEAEKVIIYSSKDQKCSHLGDLQA